MKSVKQSLVYFRDVFPFRYLLLDSFNMLGVAYLANILYVRNYLSVFDKYRTLRVSLK